MQMKWMMNFVSELQGSSPGIDVETLLSSSSDEASAASHETESAASRMAAGAAERHITSDLVGRRGSGIAMKAVVILLTLCLSLAACNILDGGRGPLAQNWGSTSACGRC
jgi:hypothetical protein